MSTSLFPPLTLIVATTPSLGLGFRGVLPWPPLKADLAFFARVTKRSPPPAAEFPTTTSNTDANVPAASHSTASRCSINAVIMGRRTWDSIPLKFRPLRGRINVVVSRRPVDVSADSKGEEAVMRVESIEEGLEKLQRGDWVREVKNETIRGDGMNETSLGRVFVIGGAQVYKSVLAMRVCERILWTRIEREYECDVWFPKGVLGEGGNAGVWERKEERELDEWCGEKGVGQRQEEDGVAFTVEMWERSRIGTQRGTEIGGSDAR